MQGVVQEVIEPYSSWPQSTIEYHFRSFSESPYHEVLRNPASIKAFVVETMGVEPTTSAVRVRRSPN